ncbi:hypothetical protein [Nocardioides alkalitolerans]|uniref:hypothetical protein n=1 Tax=Nocardioides alkalitolerans TaxID=281714 RepID=UPI0003FBCBE2|nr:hypothetical protein [Nocardioides alkalitolerans]
MTPDPTPGPNGRDPLGSDPDHDQDSEPTTADGGAAETGQLDPDSEPASDPDPAPGRADA